MRLIDADALMHEIEKIRWNLQMLDDTQSSDKVWSGVRMAEKRVEDAPTIDAVPIVLCKDCKHCDSKYQNPLKEKLNLYGLCESTETMVYSDDFCSYAEREDNG